MNSKYLQTKVKNDIQKLIIMSSLNGNKDINYKNISHLINEPQEVNDFPRTKKASIILWCLKINQVKKVIHTDIIINISKYIDISVIMEDIDEIIKNYSRTSIVQNIVEEIIIKIINESYSNTLSSIFSKFLIFGVNYKILHIIIDNKNIISPLLCPNLFSNVLCKKINKYIYVDENHTRPIFNIIDRLTLLLDANFVSRDKVEKIALDIKNNIPFMSDMLNVPHSNLYLGRWDLSIINDVSYFENCKNFIDKFNDPCIAQHDPPK